MLFDAPGYEFASPALSPDASTIAYAAHDGIYVRPLGSGAPRKLTSAQYPSFLVWSPDGQRLAYVSDNAWFVYGLGNLGNLSPSSISIATLPILRQRRRPSITCSRRSKTRWP